jgi:hypothetical protein
MEQYVVVGSPGNYVIKIAETDEEIASGMSAAAAQETADNLNAQGTNVNNEENTGTDTDEGDDSLTGDFGSLFDKLKKAIEGIGASSADAPDFVATPQQIEDLLPWLSGKGNLLQEYTNQYIETGSAEFALAAVRNTEEYAEFYPGIKRGDGSLRMNESQYEQVREGYYRILLENDLNPIVFESAGKVGALIAGDVSVAEFKGRIESTRQAFRDNPIAEEIKQYYSANFDIDLSDNAVFAAALDPDVSIGILQGQIQQAELGAEAALRNLDLSTEQAQRLIQAGITQAGGQRLFSRASEYIQRLNRLRVAQGRTNEIELQDIIQSEVQQDPQAQLEQQRILSQQASMSSLQTGAAKTQGGAVAGLEEA